MRRRDFLRTAPLIGAAGLSLSASGRAGAHPGPYEPYGSVDVEGTKEAVISPDGNVAYLATTTGYAAVDVSVPDRPRLLADVRDPVDDHEDGPLRGIFDVKLDATDPTTLAVVGPANPLPGAVAGLLVVDVSDPAAPERRAFHETDYPIHNCFVRDGRAFLTANAGGEHALVVVDVDSGEAVGRWSLAEADSAWEDVSGRRRPLHDVFVREDTAYLAHWDAGTWILDVSDPAAPTLLGSVDAPDPAELAAGSGAGEDVVPPGNHHYVATDESGTLLGVGKESWARRVSTTDGGESTGEGESTLVGGPSGIDLWDVSDPSDPRRRGTVDPPPSPDPTYGGVWTTAHNFEFRDGRLYSSWYRGGVKRHDVSDPSAPEELAWWRTPDETSFWTARLAKPGAETGYFVGASRGVGDVSGRLYTFPDHAGQQATPPDLGGTASETTDSLVVTGTPERGTAAESTGTTGAPSDASADAPGFGAGVALGALGLASWRLRRRTRERTPSAERDRP